MNSKIRVGSLGLGRAGRNMHMPEISMFPDFFEVSAGCDHAADRRENLPELFRVVKIYDDYQDMLADPALDLITIATRNADHTPHALMALEAGKAVVVDKPFYLHYTYMEPRLHHLALLFDNHNLRTLVLWPYPKI